jgi:hypothetical protein
MKPDFSRYSIKELKDVIANIDNERYPERKREAENILRHKLETGEIDKKPVLTASNKRRMGIVFGICLVLYSLGMLSKPVFENSVWLRSGGELTYSQSPLIFWFYTLLFTLSLFSGIYFIVKSWSLK